ncbi:MAG: cyclic nucleotide-binding domain-containing protein [Cyanobacteria bacterium P01_D01_bin.36]
MLRIAIANSPTQIDEVLRLRHQVLISATDATTEKPKRLMDRFDAFPTTTHVTAILNNQIIASLRLTFDSEEKTPADEYYNFRAELPAGSKLLSCDLHCVHPDFHLPQVTVGLLSVASYLAMSEDVTHIAAPVAKDVAPILENMGFRSLFANGKRASRMLPMMLNLRQDLKDPFIRFTEQNDLQGIMHSYGCALYEPGEAILRAGTVGNCAFVIADGEVDVKHAGSSDVVDTMGVGEVFGEMTLLTDHVRSADIIAKTRVRTMVLEKSVFVKHLTTEPKVALMLLQSMGHRMNHLIDYCHNLTA